MERLPLLGGSYSARSIIANAQRCINLYPEMNPKDAPVPLTHYQRPGLRPLAGGPNSAVRCLYRASNGTGYGIIGSNVYLIDPDWTLNLLGTITPDRKNICSMIDNGFEVMIVDGSQNGWKVDLITNVFSQIVDPSTLFNGADRVDYIDTYTLWNIPGTRAFGSTLSNSLTFDPLFFASKTDYPDLLQTLIVNRHELLLIGSLKSEIWYDAGNPLFPFAELPGTYVEHGTASKYSVASADIAVYWLGQDLEGQGIVFRHRGYETKRISNHALEYALQQMAAFSAITDAIGYTYQQGGHVFYVLTFPSGNQTWVFDEAVGDPNVAWHQRAWTDANGNLNRDRTNCAAFMYGTNVVGDWENGTIYALDTNVYTDTVAGVVCPISFIRTFPHLMSGIGSQGQPMLANGKRVQHSAFVADMECGTTDKDAAGNPPQIWLRYSDDRGKTFSGEILQSAGATGEYLTQPLWRGMGIARDRVYEVGYSFAGPAALNGAYVEGAVLES